MSGGAAAGGRLVVVAVGGVEYALAGRIARSLPAPAPLPEAIRHGGEDYPVVDLPALFRNGGPPAPDPWLLLVESGALRRALAVEDVMGVETVDRDSLQPVPPVYPEDERRRWEGLVPRPDGRVLVVLRLEPLPTVGAGDAAGEG